MTRNEFHNEVLRAIAGLMKHSECLSCVQIRAEVVNRFGEEAGQEVVCRGNDYDDDVQLRTVSRYIFELGKRWKENDAVPAKTSIKKAWKATEREMRKEVEKWLASAREGFDEEPIDPSDAVASPHPDHPPEERPSEKDKNPPPQERTPKGDPSSPRNEDEPSSSPTAPTEEVLASPASDRRAP